MKRTLLQHCCQHAALIPLRFKAAYAPIINMQLMLLA